MKLVSGESDLTEADFFPGALLFGGMNEQGKPMVQALNHAQAINLSLQQSEAKRAAIREAFYFSIMQLINRPQMTATEFTGFQEEKLRQLAPNLERIQQGGLTPMITRRFRMLQRAGQLPPPPPEIENHLLTIDYLSPLAKVMKIAEGRATMTLIGQMTQLAQFRPEVMDNLDVDAAVSVLHSAGSAPPVLLTDPQKVEQIRAARAQQQQQQVDLENTKTSVEIAATAGHAQQAATLAKGRAA